tara:strand:- start:830 stop:1012 length:183 start_codon:yes stop_codon:yes gene_type:complete
MPSFVFFVVLTVGVAFLMNWIFMTYLFDCTVCTHANKMAFADAQLGTDTTESQDIANFCD